MTMAHNIIMTGVPRNIHATLVSEYPYRTRQAAVGNIRFEGALIGEKSFKYQARKFYNQIPTEMRKLGKLPFKKKIKTWVKQNIPVR